MRRRHLVELHELAWFPRCWRDLLTDVMSFFAESFRPYAAIAGRVHDAMSRCGEATILDLCAGAAAPVLTVQEELARRGVAVSVTATDLYPHERAFRQLGAFRRQGVRYLAEPVDAKQVPAAIGGFRTFFSAFHHFQPCDAAAILADGARRGRGVGVFEYTERSLLRWGPQVVFMPLLVWLATPFIRPRTGRRLLWTYLVPVIPLVAAWDILVSVLRSYDPDELLELASGVGESDYQWEAGREAAFGPCRVTYLLGVPGRPREP